jgi:predicted glycosyltransferase
VGRGSAYLAHLSVLINKPYIAFVDTEHAKLMAWLTLPFANVILTPSCFKKKINQKKHIKFDGYKELAYLHPNYFKPDPSVLGELGLGKDDKFILMRFVSWSASHDTGQHGISQKMRAEYLSKLKQYGKVFIVSEGELGKELEKYELKIAPEKFHSLLSYAQLYIGEGGSTATEAATLGTPSIHISSTAKFCGVFDDLHNNYNLIYTFSDDRQALEKTLDILEDHESKKKLAQRRNKMLKEKIDVTAFMIDFIENYPDSFYELKEKGQGG